MYVEAPAKHSGHTELTLRLQISQHYTVFSLNQVKPGAQIGVNMNLSRLISSVRGSPPGKLMRVCKCGL